VRLIAIRRFCFSATAAFVSISVLQAIPAGTASAQQLTVIPSQLAATGVACPKCGRIHAPKQVVPAVSRTIATSPSRGTVVTSAPTVIQTSMPSASGTTVTVAKPSSQATVWSTIGGGVQNVLSMLNGQRARQGLRSLRYDASLQSVAERRARQMASTGTKSHPPGSFAPGRYEGVGWSSSFSPRGVSACYTSDPNMTAAGAAMVTGRDGVYFAVVYR
jgi:hypothetical protein